MGDSPTRRQPILFNREQKNSLTGWYRLQLVQTIKCFSAIEIALFPPHYGSFVKEIGRFFGLTCTYNLDIVNCKRKRLLFQYPIFLPAEEIARGNRIASKVIKK